MNYEIASFANWTDQLVGNPIPAGVADVIAGNVAVHGGHAVEHEQNAKQGHGPKATSVIAQPSKIEPDFGAKIVLNQPQWLVREHILHLHPSFKEQLAIAAMLVVNSFCSYVQFLKKHKIGI